MTKKFKWFSWPILKWWLISGVISLPFGLFYALVRNVYHYGDRWMWISIIASVIVNFLIQGMPPEE